MFVAHFAWWLSIEGLNQVEEVALELLWISLFVSLTFLLHSVCLKLVLLLDNFFMHFSHLSIDFSKGLPIGLALFSGHRQPLRCIGGVLLRFSDKVLLKGELLASSDHLLLPLAIVLELVFDAEHFEFLRSLVVVMLFEAFFFTN